MSDKMSFDEYGRGIFEGILGTLLVEFVIFGIVLLIWGIYV